MSGALSMDSLLPVAQPFIIFSLPRSRSAWMSHFLSYAGNKVGHDTLIQCPTIASFLDQFLLGTLAGSCETAGVLGWRLIRHLLPEAQLLVVRRNEGEVIDSLRKFGLAENPREIEIRAVMLDLLSSQPGVVTIPYEALDDGQVCQALFERCLGIPMDWTWWGQLARTNIQVKMPQRLLALIENQDQIQGLKADLARQLAQIPEDQCRIYH
jgi:hypothetical protein